MLSVWCHCDIFIAKSERRAAGDVQTSAGIVPKQFCIGNLIASLTTLKQANRTVVHFYRTARCMKDCFAFLEAIHHQEET